MLREDQLVDLREAHRRNDWIKACEISYANSFMGRKESSSHMEWLLDETIGCMLRNGVHPSMVRAVTDRECSVTWEVFAEQVKNYEYYASYGGHMVNQDLRVCGSNWWMERKEYDGSEWWEFKHNITYPSPVDNAVQFQHR